MKMIGFTLAVLLLLPGFVGLFCLFLLAVLTVPAEYVYQVKLSFFHSLQHLLCNDVYTQLMLVGGFISYLSMIILWQL